MGDLNAHTYKNKSPVCGRIVGSDLDKVHISKGESHVIPIQWYFVSKENIEKYNQNTIKNRENLIDKISCFEVANIDFID